MKHPYITRLATTILLLTVGYSFSFADVIVKKDTVTGIVIGKKKEPIPGAKVEIVGQPYSTYTDFDGRFNIKCEPGAKKVQVSYPKMRDVKKKIAPDMTVQIGRSWRQVPEKYQWFVGANIGVGVMTTDLDERYGWDATYISPNISLMAGRLKAVGWYLKYFLSPSVKPASTDYWNIYYPSPEDPEEFLAAEGYDASESRGYSTGLILGGIVRLGCPLHLYLGGGFSYNNITNIPIPLDHHYGWQIDMGLLFRIKDNFGINWSWNLGADRDWDINAGTVTSLGVSYFFNK